jgi:hypothetical protein
MKYTDGHADSTPPFARFKETAHSSGYVTEQYSIVKCHEAVVRASYSESPVLEFRSTVWL